MMSATARPVLYWFAPGGAAWYSFLTQVRDTGVPIRNTDFGTAT